MVDQGTFKTTEKMICSFVVLSGQGVIVLPESDKLSSFYSGYIYKLDVR